MQPTSHPDQPTGKRKDSDMTQHPLTMANAVHAVAQLPTTKLAALLTREGETYASVELVDRLRAAYPDVWAALVLNLHKAPRWSDFDADIIRTARHQLGRNSRAA